jgi:Cu(I)/Ag(I) efflux system membrane fusion protein
VVRPGAYADISMNLGGEARLSVPTEAVLRDSSGAHIIVALGGGRFAGRDVRTGASANAQTEILAGLEPGELIVASGQFMLDSEVNLREGLAKLQPPSTLKIGPDTPLSDLPIDATTLAEIDHFTDIALYFHEALTDGYRIDPNFVDPAIQLGERLQTRFANTKLVPILEMSETILRVAKDARKDQALADQLSQLMEALEPWLLEGAPIHYRDAGLTLFKDAESGRIWLQESEAPTNPYSDADAEIVAWPDPMAGMEMPASDGHSPDPDTGQR